MRATDFLTRFWTKARPEGDCLIWTAARDKDGYGKFGIQINGRTKTFRAPRIAYEITHGVEIPDGLKVLHTCDTPACVQPRHLWLGTDTDNARDKSRKGRWRGYNMSNRRRDSHGNFI